MKKDDMIKRLDELSGPAPWDLDQAKQVWSATVDDYTLLVKKGNGNCSWQVEHARYGVLLAWTPSSVVAYAKRDAIDFTRAHVLGQTVEQHAE